MQWLVLQASKAFTIYHHYEMSSLFLFSLKNSKTVSKCHLLQWLVFQAITISPLFVTITIFFFFFFLKKYFYSFVCIGVVGGCEKIEIREYIVWRRRMTINIFICCQYISCLHVLNLQCYG